VPTVEESLPQAIEAFRAFMEGLDRDAPTTVSCHSDADGVTAGAIMHQTLERLGFPRLAILVTGKGQNAYTPRTREQVAATHPATLFVLDLGCQEEPVVPGVPTLFVDHHRPLGVPPLGTLISSHTWEPIPNASLLAWWLCGAVADVDDLEWLAAMGTLSDLGDKAPFDIIPRAKKRYKAKWLREATTLVNAARRSSTGDAETALRALLQASHPRQIVEGETEEGRRLWECRAEVKAAFAEGKRAAPTFSGPVALVRVDSPCQIHPLVAQIWRTRLPKYIVLVANEGYMPGYVAFSMRSSGDVNVLDFLGSIEVDVAEGYMGYGHDQATGGIIPLASWNELLRRLGFGEEVLVKEDDALSPA
jgi:single-stranded DNA-specific DHH superfamily exonuclease